MKFDALDEKLRAFETVNDLSVLPGLYIVVRIDGRGFTRLTRDVERFDAPYDVQFRDLMVSTLRQVMQCGFQSVYGYTQSDEMSVLLRRNDDTFGRRLRKLNSVFAGEASAYFSVELGRAAAFDCRVSQLPRIADVADYFRWRQEDAARNALHGHCYWTQRRQGLSAREATRYLGGLSVGDRNELLFREAGINFNDLPLWQKRGVGVYWQTYAKSATNPVTGEAVRAERRRLVTDLELPMKDAYDTFVRERILDA